MFMERRKIEFGILAVLIATLVCLAGCGKEQGNVAAQEAPPPQQIIPGVDVTLFAVEHPEQYPIVTATRYEAPSQLVTTGVVLPDISRSVPVITLASGRVVDIRARLGDKVQKDQVLLRVRSDDVAVGFDAYRKAVADELLARKQLERTKDLYEHGAMAQQDLEVAQDNEADAKTTLETTTEHLRLLGNDPDKPNGIVDIVAPISGVITDQEITNAASVQAYSSPNPFTISDLTAVWVVCDVYENDMANVRIGETADVKLNAYPDKMIKGRVSNVGAILDPNIRTAKVRLEVPNPGEFMRPGMFATATFYSLDKKTYTSVPSSAILHLHDRDWVFIPTQGKFRRTEVTSGAQLANGMQEITNGLQPGQQVVSNAGTIQNAIDNE
ncbi:MAG TPA: efflux RND transporter periplasmic adaptor subunit [Candidatus Saccharimonadales bacterium]|jgi:cobalt-zinc-cadmium efflux system membrane fusion protein|nr:efflux RND transporter periplasmic adaptor subunit [Candidatus Saccharimonadales bacterium]